MSVVVKLHTLGSRTEDTGSLVEVDGKNFVRVAGECVGCAFDRPSAELDKEQTDRACQEAHCGLRGRYVKA